MNKGFAYMKKRLSKDEKETQVLLGLVELYIQTGTPIGSNTLKENGFEHISSATIRNYFSNLEKQGYLLQQHSSGGRVPTGRAYKLYAQKSLEEATLDIEDKRTILSELDKETREVALYLQHASELLSNLTESAVFISSPRFDQDFITSIKLVSIDNARTLAIILTDFGLVFTETLFWHEPLSDSTLKNLELYFLARLRDREKPLLTPEELEISLHFYNEIFLRHIVKYSSFYHEDLYKTGFSKLLSYPELHDANILTGSLSFFEHPVNMNTLLKECIESNDLSMWIEDDLNFYSTQPLPCSILAIPYEIQGKPVGAIALLGPSRIPYKRLIGILRCFATALSENLTRDLCKHKISYRNPQSQLPEANASYVEEAKYLLVEDKR